MGLPACQRTLFLSEPTVDWHLEGTPDGGAPLDASVPADGGCVHHQQTQSLREHDIDRCQGLAHAVPHDDGVQLRFDETVRLSLTNVDLAPVVTFEQPVQVDFSRRWVPACGGFCAGGTTTSHLVVRDLDGGLVWAGTQDRSLTDALLTELLGPERLSLGSCGATLSNGCGSSVIEYSSIKVGSAIQVVLLAGQPQRFATASGVYEVVWSDPVVRHSVNGCGVLEGSPPGASPYFTLRKL